MKIILFGHLNGSAGVQCRERGNRSVNDQPSIQTGSNRTTRWMLVCRTLIVVNGGFFYRKGSQAFVSVFSVVFFSVVLLSALISNAAPLPQQSAAGTDSDFGATPGLDLEMIQAGWLSLFDGETLFGWKAESAAGGECNWHIEQSEIRASEGEPGFLRTTTQFDDYELRLEFKGDPHTNSAVFLRTSPIPKNLKTDCYELNIAHREDHEFPTGSLVNRAATKLDFKTEQWNRLRVIVDGAQIRIWINDLETLVYEDPKPVGRGFISLQYRFGSIAFRNICLLPLKVPEIELDKNLSAWNTDQSGASKFSVTDDHELQITGGQGQLETKNQYADFVLSLKCKTNADGLNSGIFFRCIPAEAMNGYESQIQNQFKNDDRTNPVDCGTGGIFRRVNARRVNANDRQWFIKSIIATGPHIAVWVNGYQVTDWSDTRAPNPNPRSGLRLESGTIMIQGHDPTTDISMREIRIRELKARGK